MNHEARYCFLVFVPYAGTTQGEFAVLAAVLVLGGFVTGFPMLLGHLIPQTCINMGFVQLISCA